jgi:hypothetical protein
MERINHRDHHQMIQKMVVIIIINGKEEKIKIEMIKTIKIKGR